MDKHLDDKDVLLVKEYGKDELHVAGMDKNGKVSAHKTGTGENPDFLKIGANASELESFFENFARQVKNPTHFGFFRAPAWQVKETAQKLQEAHRNPDNPQNCAFIDMHRVNPADHTKNWEQSQQSKQAQQNPAINPDHVHWYKFEQYGVTRQTLETLGEIDKLLDYRKTGLMPVTIKLDEETPPLRTDGRFTLRKADDDKFSPVAHLIRHKPELDRPYFGVTFTEEDKKNLLATGNLGRIIEAEYKPGVKTPVYLSLDKLTNELVAFRKEHVRVPENYKGATLSAEQRKQLGEGKAILVDGMITNKGEPFKNPAYVQFNADKRYFELIFDRDKKHEQSQKQGQEQVNGQKEVPKTFRKKELTEDQRSSLDEGKTVYTGGLLDNKGKTYVGYITLNKETGKLDFMFPKDYKAALAAGTVIPDDRHKVQVAANNEGKTTEATKNLKEPLKPGQTKPDEKQAEKQKEKQEEQKQDKPKRGKKI